VKKEVEFVVNRGNEMSGGFTASDRNFDIDVVKAELE
jgi:hypothetical protein